ncbi:spore coat U domain-containing protein [Stenotrophomonas sp.]|uniref:Csu type fimbrial protein n=1 Tax=Stenotrophomonas sp. TaxID=69392 RepID=UPI00289721F9|nr:spore coat U domain-containing protein [Stenotrophomonas sp.]
MPPLRSGLRQDQGILSKLLLVLLLWSSLPATAQQSCRVLSSTPLDFGTVSSAGDSTASATLTVSCQGLPGVPVQVTVCAFIDEGTPPGIAPRRLDNGVNAFMNYDLYANAARNQLIGSLSSGHPIFYSNLSIPLTGTAQINLTAYGRIPPGQNLPAAYLYEGFPGPGQLRYSFAAPFGGAPSPENCRDGVAPVFGSAGQSTFLFGPVQARATANCVLNLASDLDFGTVTRLDSTREASSTIQLRCATDTDWSVTLSNGLNALNGQRRMVSNGNYLPYELYRDPALLIPWGDTLPTAAADTGDNEDMSLTVYGQVFAQPEAVPGRYSDTITVTLTY